MRTFASITAASAGLNAVTAKAGTQAHNHTCWMPACAGMTNPGDVMIISK